MYTSYVEHKDQPVKITVGPEYEATKDLPVKALVPRLKAAISERLAELKATGTIPRVVRAYVSYDGPAYSATLMIKIAGPEAWVITYDTFGNPHTTLAATNLVAGLEVLREAYNRTTTNTLADGSRYYGSTWIEARG